MSRADAETILRAAIAAADSAPLVQRALLHAPELKRARNIHVLAVGKAAIPMIHAALPAIASRVRTALAVAPPGETQTDLPGYVRMLRTAHPLPDAASAYAGAAAEMMLAGVADDDLVLVLLSGGASALLVLPYSDIAISDYAHCISLLLHSGAAIEELNTVRTQLDRVKGGGLAALAAPAHVLGLVLSDVVGDRLDVIASAPLSHTHTTHADAIEILRARGVWDACAPAIRQRLLGPDIPRDPALFARVRLDIVGNNAVAVAGAAQTAAKLGYAVELHPEVVTGAARNAGAALANMACTYAVAAPTCILAGGETTVTVTGTGSGGRNQELVLGALLALGEENCAGVTIGSIGTDGIDGSSDAAGAAVDVTVLRHARDLSLDARACLDDNDSHTFLHRVGACIHTGPTGTNVMDVQVILLRPT